MLHLLGHVGRPVGPDVKQDEAALQHIWEWPGLKDDMGMNKEAFAKEPQTSHRRHQQLKVSSTDTSQAVGPFLLRGSVLLFISFSKERQSSKLGWLLGCPPQKKSIFFRSSTPMNLKCAAITTRATSKYTYLSVSYQIHGTNFNFYLTSQLQNIFDFSKD